MQGSAAMAGSRSPATGGATATAAPVPSMQAYKPNFSSVFQSLASTARIVTGKQIGRAHV